MSRARFGSIRPPNGSQPREGRNPARGTSSTSTDADCKANGNYLEAVAIGVVAEVYDRDMVEDDVKPTIRTQIPRLPLDAGARKIGIPDQDFACFVKVYNELVQPKLAFKESKAGY